MTIKISEGDNPVDSQFLDFFLKGNLSLEKARRYAQAGGWACTFELQGP